jgi:prevent-host-death family protein
MCKIIGLDAMAKVTSAEFQKNFGRYRDLAQREAVAVTSHGRESVVLISADEYRRYRTLDARRAEFVWEMPEADVAALASAEPPAEAAAFNHETSPK